MLRRRPASVFQVAKSIGLAEEPQLALHGLTAVNLIATGRGTGLIGTGAVGGAEELRAAGAQREGILRHDCHFIGYLRQECHGTLRGLGMDVGVAGPAEELGRGDAIIRIVETRLAESAAGFEPPVRGHAGRHADRRRQLGDQDVALGHGFVEIGVGCAVTGSAPPRAAGVDADLVAEAVADAQHELIRIVESEVHQPRLRVDGGETGSCPEGADVPRGAPRRPCKGGVAAAVDEASVRGADARVEDERLRRAVQRISQAEDQDTDISDAVPGLAGAGAAQIELAAVPAQGEGPPVLTPAGAFRRRRDLAEIGYGAV